MSASSMHTNRVTVVMTARERHALTESAIASILAHTTRPFRLLYLDTSTPDWLRERMNARASDWGLEVVRCDEGAGQHQARAQIAPHIDTDYAVFIDNDVEVTSGWLDTLVRCADETGAGVVGPLYLWNDGVAEPRIHMAGGELTPITLEQGKTLGEGHRLIDAYPDDVAAQLAREPCDFVEFHCMLVRGDLVRSGTLFDPTINCVHEHIDVSLLAKQNGYATYFEPASRVNYRAFEPFLLADLPMLRQRWHPREGEASIAAFCRKWQLIDHPRAFDGVRAFLRGHVALIDPLRDPYADKPDRAETVARTELCQNRSQLLDLAQARGYSAEDLSEISKACLAAQRLMDGGYRPCGRPFLDHVIGTAGVLVRYDFRPELVAAALLHAAYTHCPQHPKGVQAAADAITAWLGGQQSPIEQRVRAYTLRQRDTHYAQMDTAQLELLSVRECEILALSAANDIDMYLSGEVRYSGRNDVVSPQMRGAVTHVCTMFGVVGLARTLDQAVQATETLPPLPPGLATGVNASYRFTPGKSNAVTMVSDVPRALTEQVRQQT